MADPQAGARPCVWTPTALKARIEAKHALDGLPRRTWGISAEARAVLARIVRHVEERTLTQDVATEQLRQLTRRLVLHRRAQQAIRRGEVESTVKR